MRDENDGNYERAKNSVLDAASFTALIEVVGDIFNLDVDKPTEKNMTAVPETKLTEVKR